MAIDWVRHACAMERWMLSECNSLFVILNFYSLFTILIIVRRRKREKKWTKGTRGKQCNCSRARWSRSGKFIEKRERNGIFIIPWEHSTNLNRNYVLLSSNGRDELCPLCIDASAEHCGDVLVVEPPWMWWCLGWVTPLLWWHLGCGDVLVEGQEEEEVEDEGGRALLP